METKEDFKCVNCGANTYRQLDNKTIECEYCHTKYRIKSKSPKVEISAGDVKASLDFGDVKDRVVSYVEERPLTVQKGIYVFACIAFGVFGVQYLILNKKVKFILSLIFCITGIPAIIGLVQGFMALFEDPVEFSQRINKDESSWLYRIGKKYSKDNNKIIKENEIS